MTVRIAITGLVTVRAGLRLTPPLDIALAGGEALVVTGENGAGKSTLLRTLAGLLPPAAGAIRVEGALAGDGEAAGRLAEIAHYLGHRNALKPGAAVGDELLFWQRFLRAGGARAGLGVEAALAAVDLGGVADLPVATLSAGQGRRAAIARLLVAHRPLWLLDEPTAALDAASRARFAAIARCHLGEGGLVIAATHQLLDLPGARELRLERRARHAPAGPGEGWEGWP